MCHMDEVKSKEEYSSIFANYFIDEPEFSEMGTGKLEKVISIVENQGQLIKKSKNNQNIEYAFDEGRVIVDSVPLQDSSYLLRIDVVTSELHQSTALLKKIGLM